MTDPKLPVGTAGGPKAGSEGSGPRSEGIPPSAGWLREALDRAEAWVATWPPAFREAMRRAAEEDMDGR